MKVKNLSKRRYCYAKLDENYKLQMLILAPDEIKDVPDEVAKSWIKTKEVVEYIEPKDAKKIADENEALKKELEQLKQSKDCEECHSDDKTPAQEDCDKCDNKSTKTKKSTTKSTTKKNK